MEKLGPRRATMLDMKNPGLGMVRMRSRSRARPAGVSFGVLDRHAGDGDHPPPLFEYDLWPAAVGRNRGVMVADREGVVVAYALFIFRSAYDVRTAGRSGL